MQILFKRCHRLHRSSNPASAGLLEHRRRTWDTISLRCVTHSVLLTGVGVYNTMGGGGGEVMICVDARPLEDNPRPIDCKTLLKVLESLGRQNDVFGNSSFMSITGFDPKMELI